VRPHCSGYEAHGIRHGDRVDSAPPATGWLFSPEGKPIPGCWLCEPCGTRTRDTLNEDEPGWTFEPLRFPCKHSCDPDMCMECDLEAGVR
jgi:hypothetical protein